MFTILARALGLRAPWRQDLPPKPPLMCTPNQSLLENVRSRFRRADRTAEAREAGSAYLYAHGRAEPAISRLDPRKAAPFDKLLATTGPPQLASQEPPSGRHRCRPSQVVDKGGAPAGSRSLSWRRAVPV